MIGSRDPYAGRAKEHRTYFWIGALLLVVALLFGLIGAGILGFGEKGRSPFTDARGTKGPATTGAGSETTAVTAASGGPTPFTGDSKTIKRMPKEVSDWLKHLELCERKRHDLSREAISGLQVMGTMLSGTGATTEVLKGLLGDDYDMEKANPANEVAQSAKDNRDSWRELITFFNSKPPPTECVPTRNAYQQCLTETQAMIGEIQSCLEFDPADTGAAQAAIAKLNRLTGTSAHRIDVAGKQTDNLVQEVCDRYEVQKWFRIEGDVGGGVGGFLGGK
ncbi:MAG: hypothetical protein JST30_00890 [Armatimonadetes bacterium]|nr:hypothetical protein [Armatimonadota bacterium]